MQKPSILSLCLLLVPHLAHADFDPVTGMVHLDDAAYAISFDGTNTRPDPLPVHVFDQNFSPTGVLEFVGQEESPIEGGGALAFGGTTSYILIDLRPLADQFRGRRVEIKLWEQTRGTHGGFEIAWYSGDVDAAIQGAQGGYQRMGIIPFQPTGRATDDGWVEWSSGPMDYTLAHQLDASILTALDEHTTYFWQQVSSFDPEVKTLVDGLGIYDLGPAAVPDVACTLPTEASACGPLGACTFGRCADGAAIAGPKLENQALRAQYLSRRIFLVETMEGGRGPLARFGTFRDRMTGLTDEPSNAVYWNTVAQAFDDLSDGHLSPPSPAWPGRMSPGICAYQGEADLLPGDPIAPIVFETSDNPAGRDLMPGDVLVRIDDLPVDEWRSLAHRHLRYGGDPAGRDFITTAQLIDAATMTGGKLSFARCPLPTGCEEEELINIDVDLGALMSTIFSPNPLPDWRFSFVTCDFRFNRPMEEPGVREYSFAGVRDEDGVRQILINGVPSEFRQGGALWFSTIRGALDGSGPDLMLLDQRQGGGGSIEAVDLMGNRLLAADDFYGMDLLPQMSRPLDQTLRSNLRDCSATGTSNCGNSFQWILGDSSTGTGLASTQKLAVLTGQDVSGNDFLTKLLTYRGAETRIFGPVPTYGAFGVVWGLPALAGELTGGSVQVHDTIFTETSTDTSLDFTTGSGIPPDEVVLQKQSDAVMGIDTLLARARAWLQE